MYKRQGDQLGHQAAIGVIDEDQRQRRQSGQSDAGPAAGGGQARGGRLAGGDERNGQGQQRRVRARLQRARGEQRRLGAQDALDQREGQAGAVDRGAGAVSYTHLVTDRGPGIGVEEQARIFEPRFRRAAHRETQGMGIGLYLARRICQSQGGSLAMHSEVGVGTRFVITLPARPPGPDTQDQAANT